MLTANANITNLIGTFINSVDNVQKLFKNFTRLTKVGLNNLWNKVQEYTVNIPNPTCIGRAFRLTICITNGSKCFLSKLGLINQDQLEVAEAVREADNMKAAAKNTKSTRHINCHLHICYRSQHGSLSKARESRKIHHQFQQIR